MNKLLVKKLHEKAILPARATEGSAGYDLFACLDEDIIILPGEIKKIPLKIAMEISDMNTVGLIYARSSLGTRFGVSPANCVGVIDSDYRGEVSVSLINHGKEPYKVCHGDRIAQLVLTAVHTPRIVEADTLSETDRGEGGFGSTGR